MKTLLLTLIILSIAACSDSSKSSTLEKKAYDEFIVSNFVESCVQAGGSKEKCSCYVAELPTHMSQSEFLKEEQTLVSTGKPPKKLDNAISAVKKSCATK